MAQREYQRLTRTRTRSIFSVAFSSRVSLWLGKDHLLSIETNGFTESYKRFYFRDIQAITVVGSRRRAIWNAVLGVLLLPFLVGLITNLFQASSADRSMVYLFGVFCAVIGVPLLINNLFGPACNCQLRTAVQVENLSSVSRLRKARKILALIRPLIAEAQGEIPPEEIPTRLMVLAGTPAPAAAPAAAGPAFVKDDPHAPPRMIP